MRVLYDVTPLGNGAEPGPGRTGIFRAVQGFVDEAVRRAELDSTLVALSSWYGEVQLGRYAASVGDELASRMVSTWHNPAATHDQGRDLVDRAVEAGEHSRVGRRALTELAFLEKAARPLPVTGDFDVYHSFRAGLADATRVRAATRVLMVHDLIPLLFPELFEGDRPAALRTILATLGPDDLVVANSACTRDDVCDHLDIDPARVDVVPLAADKNVFHRVRDEAVVTAARRRHGLGDAPYILSVATLEPRKNIEGLLRAFFTLLDAGEAGELTLALVGASGWMTDGLRASIDAHPRGAELVTLTGYVPDEDLAPLYSGAEAFVYPSRYEGFGLPVLEAMCCGTPVVTSYARALTDLTEGCALAADPSDVDAFCDALLTACGNAELGRAGERRATQFSWEHTVNLTLDLYERAARTR